MNAWAWTKKAVETAMKTRTPLPDTRGNLYYIATSGQVLAATRKRSKQEQKAERKRKIAILKDNN